MSEQRYKMADKSMLSLQRLMRHYSFVDKTTFNWARWNNAIKQ